MNSNRFERQIRLFGKEGQEKIQKAHVAVVGVGGLGSHVVQQLAFLGVGSMLLIDHDNLEESNLNRLIGARYDDSVSNTRKVDNAERLVGSISQSINVEKIPYSLMTEEAFSAIKKSNWVFGCLDNDGSRLVLNELCVAYEIPYCDLASDIFESNGLSYGGRVFVNSNDRGCLSCYGLLSSSDTSADLATDEVIEDLESIYGVSGEYLDETGPSVVSIDGVVASLAVTEFMVMITGLREPRRLLRYHGDRGIVNVITDEPLPDCYYCKSVRGRRMDIDVERYYRRS